MKQGLRPREWATRKLIQQRGPETEIPQREGSPEASTEFGVGFIQRGIVLSSAVGMA
jgi:hypothetical protein